MGSWWPAAGLGVVNVAWDLLKEVTIILITSNIFGPQVNSRTVIHVIRLTSFL